MKRDNAKGKMSAACKYGWTARQMLRCETANSMYVKRISKDALTLFVKCMKS